MEVPAEKPRLGSAAGAESHEENMENQSEATSALDSCPMCLMQFSGRLSQLDIDGHLARCLSESADDVMCLVLAPHDLDVNPKDVMFST
ncbi:hypothetical protein HGM15179_009614 [Zosterops borbonicus]|uniref:UBZ2-type domain-containing protein n=1 Tax=Zosterops borbonicus TaxID=364589 RepID=A0A8K1GFI5_9PASS|nr:hypothetical protein HGM15179_009614 [Zosterops borbonicus]